MSGESGRRTVIAVVLLWNGRLGLFKRSAAVSSDVGLWHCITGFVEPDETPLSGAARELMEETGLGARDLTHLTEGRVLRRTDKDGDVWTVHTYLAETPKRRLRLNVEHDEYRWVPPCRIARFDGQVSWLGDVVEAAMASRTDFAASAQPGSPPSGWPLESSTLADSVACISTTREEDYEGGNVSH